MGSGRAKSAPVDLRQYSILPNNEQYRYSIMDYATTPFHLDREKALLKEMQEISGDYQSLKDAFTYSTYSTDYHNGNIVRFFDPLSVEEMDKPLRVSKVFTEKDWKRVYDELDLDNSPNEYTLLLKVDKLLEGRLSEVYDNMHLSLSKLNREFLYVPVEPLLKGVSPIPPQAVKDALINIYRGKNPYIKNPLARGIYEYDVQTSPYTHSDNVLISQAIIQSLGVSEKLKSTFLESVPEIPLLLDSLSFNSSQEDGDEGVYAFYTHADRGITTTPNSFSYFRLSSIGLNSSFRTPHTVGATPFDTMTHEFGHALHASLVDYYTDPMSPQTSKTESFQKKENWDLFYSPFGSSDNSSLPFEAVSPYGNTNKKEAFTEAFVMYTLGSEPRNGYGDKYYAVFKQFMKDMGLEKFKGMNNFGQEFTRELPTKSTVKLKTLSSTPKQEASAPLSYSINGKKYTYTKNENAIKQGYFVKTVNKVRYTIDINTGRILRQKGVK